MTPEVKQRIEQIRQGIVPEGYVKDKDGIYPRDWASKKIGQWLKLAERSIVLQDEEEYQLVTIRRGFGGVDSRGSFLGKNVLVKNYFIVKTGDFIISKRQIAHGACGIVSPELDGAVVSNEYNVFLPQDGTNIQMFNLMMQLPHYKRLFYLMSDGVHIEKLLFKTQDWMKRTLAMPLLKEQKKIAEILATLDKAIELQGRKIEELKRFKKGCLEKMFPRKGQKAPEKRFPGFTDNWEQRKLSEMCGTFEYGLNAAAKEFDGKNKYIRITDIDDASREFLLSDLSSPDICLDGMSKYLLSSGDIVFARTGASVGKTYIYRENDGIVYFAGFLIRAKVNEDNDAEFVFQSTLSPSYEKYIRITSQRSGQPGVNAQEYGEYDLFAPSKEEQQRIGQFLRGIDNLITLHQRKLEEMKKQKKALMQLLLTGIVRVGI